MAKNSAKKIPKETELEETTTTPITTEENQTQTSLEQTSIPVQNDAGAEEAQTPTKPKADKKVKEDKKVSAIPKAVDGDSDIEMHDASLKLLNAQEAVAYIMTQADQVGTFQRLKRNRQLASITQTVLALQEVDINVEE